MRGLFCEDVRFGEGDEVKVGSHCSDSEEVGLTSLSKKTLSNVGFEEGLLTKKLEILEKGNTDSWNTTSLEICIFLLLKLKTL